MLYTRFFQRDQGGPTIAKNELGEQVSWGMPIIPKRQRFCCAQIRIHKREAMRVRSTA